MRDQSIILLMFAMLVVSGLVVIISGLRHRMKLLELMHRERLAMIERGLTPPPETDPAAFDRGFRARRSMAAGRMQTIGVLMTGFGLALAVLIGIAANAPDVGMGIGGAIAVLGVAFLVNAQVAGRNAPPVDIPPVPPPMPPTAPSGDTTPPFAPR